MAEPVPAALLAGLAGRADEVASTVVRRLGGEIASYRPVPAAEIDASVREILDLVVEVLRTGVVPPPQDIRQAELSSRARSRQDVPIQDIMQAFRVTMSTVVDALVEVAGRVDLPPRDLVRSTRLLWSFSDAYTTNQVRVYRRSDIDRALADARRAQRLVQALLVPATSAAEVLDAAALFDLAVEVPYVAVRGRVLSDDGSLDGLRRTLQEDARRRGHRAVFTVVGTECLGVTPVRPRLPDLRALVAVGPPTSLVEAHASFRAAGDVLRAALRLGTTGVVALSDLGWRAAAAQTDEVVALLRERYREPLVELGGYGEVLWAAVAAYLAADRSVPRAAAGVPVHVNTLRHRLRRFEEVTGCSLEATDTLVGLGFLLSVSPPGEASRPARG